MGELKYIVGVLIPLRVRISCQYKSTQNTTKMFLFESHIKTGMVLILVSQLSQQKEMGYPFSYFGKNNFKEVPHAAGNDYKDTPSF